MKKEQRIIELKQQIEEKEAEYAAVNAVQYALKILLNSFYGVFSNEYFRYFDIRLASAVTCCGQVCIKGPAAYLESKLPQVPTVYSDTDSLFLDMTQVLEDRFDGDYTPPRSREFIKKFNKQIISPLIAEYYDKLSAGLNTFKNTYEMDCEVISDNTLFVGKKRYVMKLVWEVKAGNLDIDGKPELKIKGIEIVRTSTPGVVRKELKKLIGLLMKTNDNDTCIEFIEDFKQRFRKLNFLDVANPRTVNGLHKYSLGITKGIPIHVRAAHVYNQALRELNLKNYEPIRESDKIRFAYIKVPNRFGENVIGCKNEMPPEIQEHFEIDFDLQFSKAALAPIQLIFDALEWTTEKTASLSSFFQ